MTEAMYALMRATVLEFADRIDALTARVAALEAAKFEPLTFPPIDLRELEGLKQ